MNKKAINIVLSFCIMLVCFIIAFLFYFKHSISDSKKVYKKNIKSVVEVKATLEGVSDSFGTAVIYDKEKYAITNAHVISHIEEEGNVLFDNVYIRFAQENDYIPVEVIRVDYTVDLAIIKINCIKDVAPISLSKKEYNSGDTVYAIGNSSNFGIGISKGIISVREVNIIYDDDKRAVIQCDLNILSGNSGGALVDEKGNLIGITTFRTKDSSGKINYGFVYAIPLKTIQEFIGGVKL